MNIEILRAKIHRATVTECNINYIGSITIDRDLLDACGIIPNEKVHVVDINNGERFITYVFEGEPGSGVICINGAAARKVHEGDKVIIIAYASMPLEEAKKFTPVVIFPDEDNKLQT